MKIQFCYASAVPAALTVKVRRLLRHAPKRATSGVHHLVLDISARFSHSVCNPLPNRQWSRWNTADASPGCPRSRHMSLAANRLAVTALTTLPSASSAVRVASFGRSPTLGLLHRHKKDSDPLTDRGSARVYRHLQPEMIARPVWRRRKGGSVRLQLFQRLFSSERGCRGRKERYWRVCHRASAR